MSNTRDTGFLRNAIQVTDQGVTFVSGSTTLMSISSSGAVTTTGVISGSNALSASFSLNSALLNGIGSVGFATTGALLEVSSSQQQISSSLLQVSASYISLSGSYNTFSGSASTRITVDSASLQQVSSSQQQISASLLNVVANYATTGSNSFRANQSITGSLVVSSTITAQTLVVQTVTSSIVYSSGSNIFGSALGDRQTFTGSVNITGSLALAGNITSNGTAVMLGTGTTNTLPKFTGASTIGNSLLTDDGTTLNYGNNIVSIGASNTSEKYLQINSSTGILYLGGTSSEHYVYGAGSKPINFYTNGTSKMLLTASGSLGLGVTPSAWASGFIALQVKNASFWSTGNDASITSNAYYDGTNYKYIGTAAATKVYHNTDGSINWTQAPSGTSGNAITFTQTMTLDASGRLGIGTISPKAKLQVVGSISSEKKYDGMDSGLVLYYPFAENTGTTTADRSQTGMIGTLTNGATWTTGIMGYGLTLDGSNDYVTVAAPDSSVSFGTTITYAMWIYPTGTTAHRYYLIDPRGDGGQGGMDSYWLFDRVDSSTVTFTTGNSGAEVISNNVTMGLNQWYHVAAVRSGSNWKIYLNGIEIKSGTSNNTSLTLSNSFRIGTYSGAGAGPLYYFQGNIDETKIWNRTLSANEVMLLYQQGVGTNSPYTNANSNVGIGTTNTTTTAYPANGRLVVFGDETQPNLALSTNGTSAFGVVRFTNANGIAGSISMYSTSVTYNTTSDYRLKQDLKDFKGLDLISTIKTYDYEWKADNKRAYGVLAHELQEVLPQAVFGEKDAEEMQGVDYSKLVPVLVKAIQELKLENDSLKEILQRNNIN